MSNDLNICHFIGRAGRDAEVRFTQDGKAIASFSLAIGRKWNGEESTTWINCKAFGKLAEICGEYVTKGKQVYVGCEYRLNQWEKDGEKKSSPEFIVQTMQLLGGKGENRPDEARERHNQAKASGYQPQGDADSEPPPF